MAKVRDLTEEEIKAIEAEYQSGKTDYSLGITSGIPEEVKATAKMLRESRIGEVFLLLEKILFAVEEQNRLLKNFIDQIKLG